MLLLSWLAAFSIVNRALDPTYHAVPQKKKKNRGSADGALHNSADCCGWGCLGGVAPLTIFVYPTIAMKSGARLDRRSALLPLVALLALGLAFRSAPRAGAFVQPQLPDRWNTLSNSGESSPGRH